MQALQAHLPLVSTFLWWARELQNEWSVIFCDFVSHLLQVLRAEQVLVRVTSLHRLMLG